jgi:hypothetical protein
MVSVRTQNLFEPFFHRAIAFWQYQIHQEKLVSMSFRQHFYLLDFQLIPTGRRQKFKRCKCSDEKAA